MGGCRCSYRNCTVKSDKKTHMFHFPVYEKLRCHQWLCNAHRYDYLHLTVSQLRNRVICQHHFKDEYFMNYMKEKLTFEAVPTEDGPYCDSSKEEKIESEIIEKANLVINEIEQKVKYIDKKANSSLKYIDFLVTADTTTVSDVNRELWIDVPNVKSRKEEIITDTPIWKLKQLKDNNCTDFKYRKKRDVIKKPFLRSSNISIKQLDNPLDNKTMETKQTITHKKVKETIIEDLNSMNLNPNDGSNIDNNVNNESTNIFNIPVVTVPIENMSKTDSDQQSVIIDTFNNMQRTECNSLNNNYYSDNLQFQSLSNNKTFDQSQNAMQSYNYNKSQKNMKIKILSEETILNPLPFVGKLEPILPNLVLPVPNRLKGHTSSDLQISKNNYDTHNRLVVPDMLNKIEKIVAEQKANINEITESSEILKNNDVVIRDPPKIEIIESESHTTMQQKTKMYSNEKVSTPKSSLKCKVSPERLAAIEKKRIFNKKLRDMVESCLEKSNSPEKDINKGNILKTKANENIDTSLIKANKSNSVTRSQDYIVTYLEARMKKMENVLLNKIEQNSNRISELKSSVANSKQRSSSTQTSTSEESYKLFLYEEISKFLSPDAKNLVYEDLFIYKYSQSQTGNVPKVKRKRYS